MENRVEIFSGSEVAVLAVKNILEQNRIEYAERNDIQSAIHAGFGTVDKAVHLFVDVSDLEKAKEALKGLEV
ncbi:MAG: DUF2007 domain-containing protein [Flavobacteriaceae bacterium]